MGKFQLEYLEIIFDDSQRVINLVSYFGSSQSCCRQSFLLDLFGLLFPDVEQVEGLRCLIGHQAQNSGVAFESGFLQAKDNHSYSGISGHHGNIGHSVFADKIKELCVRQAEIVGGCQLIEIDDALFAY